MDTLVTRIASWLLTAREFLRRIGPYVVLEMLLPGGTLFAIGLFLYRQRISQQPRKPPRIGVSAMTQHQH